MSVNMEARERAYGRPQAEIWTLAPGHAGTRDDNRSLMTGQDTKSVVSASSAKGCTIRRQRCIYFFFLTLFSSSFQITGKLVCRNVLGYNDTILVQQEVVEPPFQTIHLKQLRVSSRRVNMTMRRFQTVLSHRLAKYRVVFVKRNRDHLYRLRQPAQRMVEQCVADTRLRVIAGPKTQ